MPFLLENQITLSTEMTIFSPGAQLVQSVGAAPHQRGNLTMADFPRPRSSEVRLSDVPAGLRMPTRPPLDVVPSLSGSPLVKTISSIVL